MRGARERSLNDLEGTGASSQNAPATAPECAPTDAVLLDRIDDVLVLTLNRPDQRNARNATFGLPEVRHGLVASAGGPISLPRRIPEQIAVELLLCGESFSAERAERLGLVNRLVKPGTALQAAVDLAGGIARHPRSAVQTTKQIVRQSRTLSEAETFAAQEPLVRVVQDSEDARAGARAFDERWRDTNEATATGRSDGGTSEAGSQ